MIHSITSPSNTSKKSCKRRERFTGFFGCVRWGGDGMYHLHKGTKGTKEGQEWKFQIPTGSSSKENPRCKIQWKHVGNSKHQTPSSKEIRMEKRHALFGRF